MALTPLFSLLALFFSLLMRKMILSFDGSAFRAEFLFMSFTFRKTYKVRHVLIFFDNSEIAHLKFFSQIEAMRITYLNKYYIS